VTECSVCVEIHSWCDQVWQWRDWARNQIMFDLECFFTAWLLITVFSQLCISERYLFHKSKKFWWSCCWEKASIFKAWWRWRSAHIAHLQSDKCVYCRNTKIASAIITFSMQSRHASEINHATSRVIEIHEQFLYLHRFIVRAQFLLLFISRAVSWFSKMITLSSQSTLCQREYLISSHARSCVVTE